MKILYKLVTKKVGINEAIKEQIKGNKRKSEDLPNLRMKLYMCNNATTLLILVLV